MDRLPFPGGRTAGSEMGHVRVALQIGNRAGGRFQPIEVLVDTGATYSWVPRDVLERLAVVPEDEWPFVLADGREVRYPVAWINIRLGARAQPTIVVFGEQGSEPILGVVTLEEFRLAVDPVNHRLISVPGRLGAAVLSLSLTRSEHACHPERRRREGSACSAPQARRICFAHPSEALGWSRLPEDGVHAQGDAWQTDRGQRLAALDGPDVGVALT